MPPPEDAAAKEERTGLIPLPDFGGSLSERAYLTGDWNGARTALATDAGIQFNLSWTQYVQSVVDGGRDTTTKYGGTFDTRLRFDLQRMGVVPGGMIDVRALSRYGDFIGVESGMILPVNANAVVPETRPIYGDYGIAVTNVTYTQFLAERFAAFIGKIDTLDGDQNEFASGRGATQFMNYGLNFAAPTAIVPASTLGAGILVLPTQNLSISSTLLNAQDTTSTVGFDDINGGIWATEARFQYRLGDLPGGVNGSFLYLFGTDRVDFGKLSFGRGEGLSLGTDDESWMAIVSAWQYVFTEDGPGEGPLDLTNGRPDRQGIGLFGRLAFADEDTNPWKFSASFGIGGRGVIPNRDDDVFGVGYGYNNLDPDRLFVGGRLDDYTQGFEAFYNLALTPAAHVTFDVQWLESNLPRADSAVVLALRLKSDF